ILPANIWIAFGVTAAAGLATVLGCILVFTSKTPSPRLLSFGLSFAGGAMVYVSLAEILNKSVLAFSEGYGDKAGFTFATASFLCGMRGVALIDLLVPNPHRGFEAKEVRHEDAAHIRRVGLMTALAITVHNFPEGLATFFATLDSPVVGLPLAMA